MGEEKGGGEENSNSKVLMLKDKTSKTIWTYLTASICYTTNTSKLSTTILQTHLYARLNNTFMRLRRIPTNTSKVSTTILQTHV